jgi:folate-dependent phosphoribosylglycinamide formyltransferase PurN
MSPSTLRVVVLTCHPFGWDTAKALSKLPEVEFLGVIYAPLPRRSIKARLRTAIRAQGWSALVLRFPLIVARKLASAVRRTQRDIDQPTGIPCFIFDDLHSVECLHAIASMQVDLAVVDGTGILRPELFNIPRLGSINLHCGKLPEYRGAPPAFWELMNGEHVCGVSVHQVTVKLDEGAVFNTAEVPLQRIPAGDPVAYVREYWHNELRPVGLQLIAWTVQELATGAANPRPQAAHDSKANRSPDRVAIAELRRRIRERR